MKVYIGNTGHIKNHKKFKILFWSRESKKPIRHRRLTRDSRNRPLIRDSRIPDFFLYKIRKNRKHRFFGFPGPKSIFEFFMIF